MIDNIKIAMYSVCVNTTALMKNKVQGLFEMTIFRCPNCDTVYVGETSRALTERIHEHRNLSKKVPKNMVEFENLETSSAITLHLIEHSHTINFNQPEILSKNWQIDRERIAAEQWFISNEPTACNTKKKAIHAAWNLL